jgi:hypothetical protein
MSANLLDIVHARPHLVFGLETCNNHYFYARPVKLHDVNVSSAPLRGQTSSSAPCTSTWVSCTLSSNRASTYKAPHVRQTEPRQGPDPRQHFSLFYRRTSVCILLPSRDLSASAHHIMRHWQMPTTGNRDCHVANWSIAYSLTICMSRLLVSQMSAGDIGECCLVGLWSLRKGLWGSCTEISPRDNDKH